MIDIVLYIGLLLLNTQHLYNNLFVARKFVVVWCLALWFVCVSLLLCGLTELLMTSVISYPMWSSVYECQGVECAHLHQTLAALKRNIPNTPMQHGYKTQHSTVTALHTLNNTVAKGFNQMAPPARTITVALNMSKAFHTINIHTLIRKLLQTNIPGTIFKFIANYSKGRKPYTTYGNHTSKQTSI